MWFVVHTLSRKLGLPAPLTSGGHLWSVVAIVLHKKGFCFDKWAPIEWGYSVFDVKESMLGNIVQRFGVVWCFDVFFPRNCFRSFLLPKHITHRDTFNG